MQGSTAGGASRDHRHRPLAATHPLGGVLAGGQGGSHAHAAAQQRMLLQPAVLQAQEQALAAFIKRHSSDRGLGLLASVQHQGRGEGCSAMSLHCLIAGKE